MTYLILIVSGLAFIGVLCYLIFRRSDIESHNVKSSVVFNFVSAVSIIAVGAWTFTTFDVLHQKEIAQEQLDDLRRKAESLESSKIELSTELVNYTQESVLKEDRRKYKGLIVKVKIKNVGNKRIIFDISNLPLKIYKVKAQGDMIGAEEVFQPELYKKIAKIGSGEENVKLDKFVFLTLSERELNYFLRLKKIIYIMLFFQQRIKIKKIVEERGRVKL